MVFIFPQNRIEVAIVLLIYIYRLSQPAALCVVETGKNFSSCLKKQTQIHQRFLHHSQISIGNFSFKQHSCRKRCFLTEKLNHQNEVYVNSEILQSCLWELGFICFFFLLSSMAGALPAQILPGHLANTVLFPRLWFWAGILVGGTAWPWTTLQAVAMKQRHLAIKYN